MQKTVSINSSVLGIINLIIYYKTNKIPEHKDIFFDNENLLNMSKFKLIDEIKKSIYISISNEELCLTRKLNKEEIEFHETHNKQMYNSNINYLNKMLRNNNTLKEETKKFLEIRYPDLLYIIKENN